MPTAQPALVGMETRSANRRCAKPPRRAALSKSGVLQDEYGIRFDP